MNEVIKKSWEEYEKLKVKIVELENEIDRLRAILAAELDYDDDYQENFRKMYVSLMKKQSGERTEKVKITNTYGFKNE